MCRATHKNCGIKAENQVTELNQMEISEKVHLVGFSTLLNNYRVRTILK
jgi:hypothetical protein